MATAELELDGKRGEANGSAKATGASGSEVDLQMLLSALTALRKGDFSVRLPTTWLGLSGKVGDTFNDVMDQLEGMTNELDRISRVVGKEGKIKQRASSSGLSGSWAGTIHSVNALVGDLVHPTSEMARVIGAVAKGDLSKAMALDIDGRQLEGEFLRTAKTVNRMVDQLGSFASEVTRVAREVGTEGKLGGQAEVKGVAGTWKDLTDSVNSMAGNLTGQVRNIADVTTAVATGDLSKKITVDVQRRVLGIERHHQHDGRSASFVCFRSDPRGARGWHRRQTRWPGPSGRRVGDVERLDRYREFHGQQFHGPGAQHRRRDDGRCQWRLVEEDHRRREGGNSRAEEHHQHDGRSAQLVWLPK